MNTKHILIAALLAGAFAPALAATATPLQFAAFDEADDIGGPADNRREIRRERIVINGQEVGMPEFDHERFGGALAHMHGKVVKGAPYSAEVVSEQQQTLADGNQIVNKTSTMSYRDSAGRTRQETRDASGAIRSVTINDAVQGTTYILHPEAKTATKIGPRADIERFAHDRARAEIRKQGGEREIERVARDKVREAMRKDGGERVIIKRVERDFDGEARERIRENVRIRIDRDIAGAPTMAGMDRIGPMIAGAFGDMKWASKATVKDLGTRDIEGVKAQGKSKSYEIPAGEIGNRNPIVVSSETWYAPELQVTVLTRRSDPRSGERTWRMASIKRDEPPAALFTVPSDYAVKDTMVQLRKIEKVEKIDAKK